MVNDEVTCFRVLDPGALRLFAWRIPTTCCNTWKLIQHFILLAFCTYPSSFAIPSSLVLVFVYS